MENKEKNTPKIYAKLFDKTEYKNQRLTDITFYPCNYILRCIDGVFEGKQLRLQPLGKRIIVGSEQKECNFYLNEKEISPRHCKLEYIEDTYYYYLSDLGSKYGTWLKINNLEEGYEINTNTKFKIYEYTLFLYFRENEDPVLQIIGGKEIGKKYILKENETITIGRLDFALLSR